jgi:hypothetical protein
MGNPMSSDPEMDFAELCLDAADRAEACFERWSQNADDAPTPRLRAIWAKAAAAEMVFANESRKCADDLLYDYDDGA